jgi:hypothetical protein
MNCFTVLNFRVYVAEILRSCSVFNWRITSWDLMSGVVVQVHLAAVRVVSEDIFIELRHFFKLV